MSQDYPPFPKILDSTMIASFRSCPQKFFREYMEHWKPNVPSVHLHAGGAYAKGLETAREAFYQDGKTAEEAMAEGLRALLTFYGSFECPPDSAKSAERMAGAFEYYFTQYPLGADEAIPITLSSGKRGIEFSFAEPTDATHPVSGDPLLYVGRMDMICDYAGGVFGLDDKTTSSLGSSWSKQWDMRSQFTGYCWGAGRAGIPLQGFLVRGVSILKTKYDTQQALTYRPQWMIDRWYDQLMKDIERMKAMWQAQEWDYDLDHACTEYSGCVFRQPCLSLDPQPWLESSFIRRVWNPLTRVEESV